MSLTNSKLPIASPRKAGLKEAVNSLKARRFSPNSILGTLLTIFSKATLAQALLIVFPLLDMSDSSLIGDGGRPDSQTRLLPDNFALAYRDLPPSI